MLYDINCRRGEEERITRSMDAISDEACQTLRRAQFESKGRNNRMGDFAGHSPTDFCKKRSVESVRVDVTGDGDGLVDA